MQNAQVNHEIKYLIKVDGEDENNQLKNKMFVRNFGGNTWGEYKTENNDSLSFNSPVEMKIDFVGNENNYFENNEYIIFYAK